ncbi:amylo-alpha-1,6-glucosidase [Chroococcidiopsis sp. CCMEE 29]|uniref:amylo-alpha-1,6-glucosidase n=1 Tax=Chroococcidiopsis sp. CCMEE 29 TaxID=155894 RepID=UPI002021B9AB|nr:amylo-alpha-1,6-glucosidase [Chroococcidiopsis sp. CCMEE 29]
MDNLDTREWLLTNGLGSFASGTVADARTRTYHGWLIAALVPPTQRTLLLSHLDASLEVAGQVVALGTNFWGSGKVDPTGFKLLRSFELNPVPTWVWGDNNWQLSRQLVMPHCWAGGAGGASNSSFCSRTLIQYRYEGCREAILKLRPMIGDRNFHHQQKAQPDLQFSQLVGQQHIRLQAIRPEQVGTPWQLRWTQGEYQGDPVWYWNYHLLEETKRGLGDREDLYSPGYLTISLQPGAAVTVEAKVGWQDSHLPLSSLEFEQAVQAEEQRLSHIFKLGKQGEQGEQGRNPKSKLWQQLLRAGDQFIVYRQSIAGPTAIAGYPWFSDWGRDTLIALPGLALTTQRFDLAKGLLRTFGRYCRYGLIPNTFPDSGAEPLYNSIDAALWWIETLGLYLEATQDWNFLAEQYPVVQQIYKAFTTGTKYNIQVDAADELVSWNDPDVALTWMDVVIEGQPITPRRGKPVEINALWYSALCWASDWAERLSRDKVADPVRLSNQARRYAQQAKQVRASLQKFWNPTVDYLYDLIEPGDRPNAQIRPNGILALSLHHCAFPASQGQRVLQLAKHSLLTPYGLRSLAPDDSEYIGKYAGNQQHRDRSYHQGTVWSWLIGPFIRAWKRLYDSEPVPFDSQPLLEHFEQQVCLGSISEIFDGDAPHTAQGAIAQAWSVAELIRHWDDVKL